MINPDLFSHATRFIRLVEDFIVEDREIESKAQSYRVGGWKIRISNILTITTTINCTVNDKRERERD